jgi:DNA polymerase-1
VISADPTKKSAAASTSVSPEAQARKRTLLIDASPLIFRAFHSVPILGGAVPLNAVYGFLRTLLKLMRENPSDYIAVCMDGDKSFRKQMEPTYKANRKETPEDLVKQFPIVAEAVKALGICCPRLTGYEADDLLATYAKMASEADHDVIVVTPDKDMLQIVSDRVSVISASSSVKIDSAAVAKKFGVSPIQVPHLQALIGDAVDNIPRVPGLTEAAAKHLVRHFGTVHKALESIDEITERSSRDALRLYGETITRSFELAKLKDDAPVPALEELLFTGIHPKNSLAFCSKYKLKSISASLEKDWIKSKGDAASPSTPAAASTKAKRTTIVVEGQEPLDTQGFIKKAPGRPKKTAAQSLPSDDDIDPLQDMPFDEPVVSSSKPLQSKVAATASSGPPKSSGRDRLLRIKEEFTSEPAKESVAVRIANEASGYSDDAQEMLEVILSRSQPNAPISPPSKADSKTTKSSVAPAESEPVATAPEVKIISAPPPIPRARRKRSPSSDLTLSVDGHISEEVDIDTDPAIVASTHQYKEKRRLKKEKATSSTTEVPSTPSAAESTVDPPSIAQTSTGEAGATSSIASPIPASTHVVQPTLSTPPASAGYATYSAPPKSPSGSSPRNDAAESFLEALKKTSPDPTSINAALANPGSLFSPATRKKPTVIATPPAPTSSNNAAMLEEAVLDGSSAEPKKRGRKPKKMEVIDPAMIGVFPASSLDNEMASISGKATTLGAASSRTSSAPAGPKPAKSPANGPGVKTSKAASSGSDDIDEDDEESNLELVDFIKNRTREIDLEFVNLYTLCKTPAERRRVIESKLKGVTVANDRESAERIIAKLMTLTDRFHACDSECVDLNLKKQGPVGNGRIICATIFVGPDMDFGNGPRIWIDNLEDDSTLQLFKEYFESEKILKVWHNYGFDRHVFFNHGIDVKGFGGDTMHMARLWDSSRRGAKAYSLEVLSRDLLLSGDAELAEHDKGVVAKTSMKMRFGRVKLKKDGTPSKSSVILPALDELQRDAEWLPEWVDYATLDAEDTWRLREVLAAKLAAMNWTGKKTMFDFYRELWLPFGELLTDMERRGIKVDRQYLRDLVPKAEKEKAECEKTFMEWATQFVGPECRFMNPGSDAQKQQLFFAPCVNKIDPSKSMPASREFEAENTDGYIEEGKKVAKKKRSFTITGLGLPFVDATDSGWPAVSHPVMSKLVGDPPEKYGKLVDLFEEKGLTGGKQACEALAASIESSKIDTLISTFMIPLAEFADANSRIHGSLNINTETGRLSSRRPNLQNQPAHEKDRFKIRRAFTCEPGNNLIVADYGQLELRLLAHMTNCKSMIDAFRSGGDFHSRTALGMYSHVKQAIDEGRVLLEWDGAKGKAPLPLLKDEFGTERRRAKTLNFSIAYGKTVMGLAKDWSVTPEEARDTLDRWYADRPEVKQWQERTIARAHVTGWTRTLLGRYRPLPEINSRDRMRRAHSERAAINTPLQGGAADITTKAMVLLHRHERLRQLGWHQLLQIHDELILEGPEESTKEALSIVTHVMSNPLPEPLLIDLVVDAKAAKTWYEAK